MMDEKAKELQMDRTETAYNLNIRGIQQNCYVTHLLYLLLHILCAASICLWKVVSNLKHQSDKHQVLVPVPYNKRESAFCLLPISPVAMASQARLQVT